MKFPWLHVIIFKFVYFSRNKIELLEFENDDLES